MMETLLPNKIELTAGSRENEAVLTVEPLTQGYGVTVGNALRRVLLSSLEGSAVTAVKIKNVPHEFTSIPGVREDILEITLNLKLLRIRITGDEPVRMTLKAKGEKEVTAEDIDAPSSVEIMNPDLHIVDLTEKGSELEMEIFAKKGKGFIPTEEQDRKDREIGMIAIDALFSPIRNVGLKVEAVRVGEITNYDRLILTVESDGTVNPRDAIMDATKILLDHFQLFMNLPEFELAAPRRRKKAAKAEDVSEKKEKAGEKEDKKEEKKKKAAKKKK